MSGRYVLTLVITFALPLAVLAQGSGKTNAKPAAKPAESRLVVMPANDMKWTDLDPSGAPEGKPEFRLGPGSYFMQPGGKYRHTTTCDKASDCVFLVESSGPFDLKAVDVAKGTKK